MNPQLLDRIRDHAAALDDAAPPVRLDEIRSLGVPPRRRAGRLPLTVAAGVVAVVGGLVVINNTRDIDDTVASLPPPTVEEAAATTADSEPRLELTGAEPTGDVQFTVASAAGAIWKDAETETYLSLTVRTGLAEVQPSPTGIGPMRELNDFPTDLGRAWVSDLGDSEPVTPLSLRMWWTRPDDDVWLLTSYWYEQATTGVDAANAVSALTGWATHIVTPDDPAATYELSNGAVTNSSMELVFSQRAGEYPSRTRTWDIDGHEVTLETTEGVAASGLQNLLDVGPPTVTTIAGRTGWLAQADDGTVHAGWPSESGVEWNRVIIPAELGPRSDEIIDSVIESAPLTDDRLPSTTAPDPLATISPITTAATDSSAASTIPSDPVNYLAIGDSVMLSAAGVLTDRGYTVDAQVSRQMIDMVEPMERLREAGVFDDVVIIHVGANGPFDKETLDAFLAPLSDVPNVIILNVYADRWWAATNNQLLADRDQEGDNIILIDWATLATRCPGDCFADDGVHLAADGQRYYAEVIREVTGI